MAFIPCVHNPYEFPKLVARFNYWKSSSGTHQNGLNRYEIFDYTCINPARASNDTNTYVIILRDCVLDVVLDCSNCTSTSTSSYIAFKVNGTVVLKSSDVSSYGNQKRATLAFSQGDVLSCEDKSDGNRVGCIIEFYECRRNIEDIGMTFLRNFYYDKVFNGGHSDVFYLEPYENRAILREGQIVVDSTNRTVYLYADFDIAITKDTSDYWTTFLMPDFATSYLPKREGASAGTSQTLITDETSTVPSKSFFIYINSNACRLAVQKGQGYTLDDHYIIYNSWQY